MHKINQRLLSILLCLAILASFVPMMAAADTGEVPAETEAALVETVEAVIEETEAATVETTEVLIEETEAATVETSEVAIEETEAATVETTAEIEEQSETIAAEEIVPAETAETVETVAVEDNSASPAESSDISSGTPDGTPPVLHGITLSVTTVKAPGTIEVIMDASDDVSGVNHGYIRFFCDETGKYLYCSLHSTYWDEESWTDVPYADGKLHGEIEIDQYVVSGKFVIDYLTVDDLAGHTAWYDRNDNSLPDSVKNLQFTVTDEEIPDGTPPVLKEVKLAANMIAAPGSIEVTMDADDDVSGVNHGYIRFFCDETGKYLYCSLHSTYWDEESWTDVPYADGKLHGEIEIDQYVVSGKFVIDYLTVDDLAGHTAWYDRNDNSLPDSVKNLQFTVLNSVPDVTTSVAKPEFVEEVKNSEEDAYIVADYSGNATVPEDVFDAISGTDKTLDLVSEGITWRFEGKDIVNDAKDIDLHVEIKPVEQDTSETGKDIQDALEEVPAVVMKFPENGTLPGKATIQVKVDYTMQEYLGTNRQLSVYYFNNQTGELELIASNLTVNGDSYVEFPITHCSYYILTVEPAAEKTEVIPVYRLYNPYTQEHLLTGGAEERDALISVGWSLDGVAWEAPVEGISVYRLYNPYDDWHTYTTSESERDTMVTAGWTVDGVVSFGYTGKDGRPIYRLFNPYVQTNYHLFTAGTDERDLLVNAGWILEGTAWYSVK